MTTEDESTDEFGELEQWLTASRPVPRAAFRGQLRRDLLDRAPVEDPRRARMLIAAYATSGTLLIAIAVVGIAGAGPLAPS